MIPMAVKTISSLLFNLFLSFTFLFFLLYIYTPHPSLFSQFSLSLLFVFRLELFLIALSYALMNFEQSEQEVPLQDIEVAFYQLSHQNSEVSLPVDEEVSDKNGKSVGSITMDEFIASIWNTDEFQLNPPLPVYEEAEKNNNVAPEPTIPQPGSFPVPPPICNKTTDEVWSQIQKSQPQQNEAEAEADADDSLASDETIQKEPTFGEMTLEDFLIKAGVVTESTLFTTILPQNHFANIPTNIPFNASYILIGTTGPNIPCARFEPHQMLPPNNHFVVRNFTATNVAVENNARNVAESSGNNGKGKKRIINGPPEVVIERRQRRMLKNRESAARSRARRQAYTVELEAELNNLKNENEELKNMLAEDERKRLQVLIQRQAPTTVQMRNEKKRKLKRPLSASW
ncbi:ABSCISIC ACID-INSENSITIVE 5-like protein 1 isoform X2 [Vigna radiata var. radiata]|uniref:ABSCISIC ACID-INSENSITIVE 5-like protein 1 isoform X2 n=1 Tax=Vigna radiata var. radiata TaxID=3916 RepID=A0A1S3TSL9_VIGRR|nr:ABSCISIC ACID-INSENSITIVE 5-like protein 1 isoform X2 [Vigna radiata var. radiata]